MTFFQVDKPTPVLNTPFFHRAYSSKKAFDDQGLIRAVEFIALPGMVFKLVGEYENPIYEVAAEFYPSSKVLYIDSRFGKKVETCLDQKKKKLPPKKVILERMIEQQNRPYVWGGNYGKGISLWEFLYPPPKGLTPFQRAQWNFAGVDCSGLLFEACGGLTPRNTSELMSYGKEVSLQEIEALDLIVYPGHVIIAIGKDKVIESRLEYGGVRISSLERCLSTIPTEITIRRFFQTPRDSGASSP